MHPCGLTRCLALPPLGECSAFVIGIHIYASMYIHKVNTPTWIHTCILFSTGVQSGLVSPPLGSAVLGFRYMYTHICIYVYMSIHLRTYIHAYYPHGGWVWISLTATLQRSSRLSSYVYTIHMHLCVRIYTYIYVYIPTYLHACILSPRPQGSGLDV